MKSNLDKALLIRLAICTFFAIIIITVDIPEKTQEMIVFLILVIWLVYEQVSKKISEKKKSDTHK